MDRPKRTIKPTIKILENEEVKLIKTEKITATPKVKQSIKKAQKIINDPPRTLNLDIPAMDLSNPKLVSYCGKLDNPFWSKYFCIPADPCTQMMMMVMFDYEINVLPAAFLEGIPALDILPEFFKPVKQAPLYSKLVNGDYETATSKSDKNIANIVKFFRNNFHIISQFKDLDDLTWIKI